MGRRTTDRDLAWRPFADLLDGDARRVRERLERLHLPEAERAFLLDLLQRRR